MMTHYRPPPINYENAEAQIQAGLSKIIENGALTFNVAELENSNTLGVCAMIAWKREATKKKCQIDFCGASERMSKIMDIYEINDFFTNSNSTCPID